MTPNDFMPELSEKHVWPDKYAPPQPFLEKTGSCRVFIGASASVLAAPHDAFISAFTSNQTCIGAIMNQCKIAVLSCIALTATRALARPPSVSASTSFRIELWEHFPCSALPD